MKIIENEIQEKLTRLAYQISRPFCYPCYREVTSTHCPSCGSDDFARILENEGIEFGVDWIVEYILETELTSVDTESAFEDSIRGSFEETTKVAWLELDTVSILRECDPVSWEIAKSEWLDQNIEDDAMMTFDGGSSYYWTFEIEQYLEKSLAVS